MRTVHSHWGAGFGRNDCGPGVIHLRTVAALTLSIFACAANAADDWEKYNELEQKERVVTWPTRTESERWLQDLAQCQGSSTSVQNMLAAHGRDDLAAWAKSVQACLEERGYKIELLKEAP